ncbi:hypothetical protein BSM4216_0956 [Bacillus smithii]|nr:hypothetical protein BSM4216_0956 [Bacillus smithii]
MIISHSVWKNQTSARKLVKGKGKSRKQNLRGTRGKAETQ